MAIKLFIIGLPGSGKSAVARNIGDYARNKSWTTRRFNDYRILNAMFRYNKQGWFKPAQLQGFNVVDITAFDFALSRLERKIARYTSSVNVGSEEIMLIQFARNDYWRAFKQFDPSFLKEAYFIYLEAKVEVCKQRIRDRVAMQEYPADDYPVSDYIFEKYYQSDIEGAMMQIKPFIDNIIRIEATRFSAMQMQADHPEMSSSVNKPESVK